MEKPDQKVELVYDELIMDEYRTERIRYLSDYYNQLVRDRDGYEYVTVPVWLIREGSVYLSGFSKLREVINNVQTEN